MRLPKHCSGKLFLLQCSPLTRKIHGALRADTLAPCTPYFLAVFSFFVARKQSKRAMMRTSTNPKLFNSAISSASGRAPAIQSAHRPTSPRASALKGASSSMSPSCNRPPGRNTRQISRNALSFSGTRLSAPLEMTTSMPASGSGRAVASARCTSTLVSPAIAAQAHARF